MLLAHPPPQSTMIPHLHSLMQRKSRRGRIDLPAGRVLTSRHLKVSASLCRGPCQTTHLADCQHHQKALSPSSIELREGINLGIISSPPSSTRGGLFNSSIIASDTLLAVAADARTVVEQSRHHPLSNIAKYESAAASRLLAPTNLGHCHFKHIFVAVKTGVIARRSVAWGNCWGERSNCHPEPHPNINN